MLRAVPVLCSAAAVVLFRRGGAGDEGHRVQPRPTAASPPRRLVRRIPPGALGVRPGRVRKAAVFSALSVLLCCVLGVAVLQSTGDAATRASVYLVYLAATNALCSLAAAALCFSAVGKKPAPREPAVQRDGAYAAQLSSEQMAALAQSFTGFWRKDSEASDSMNAAMDVIHLNWFIRQAVNVITGLDLRLTSESFTFVVTSRLKLNVREVYPTNGEPTRHLRRDLRGGGALGRCTVTPSGVSLVVEWQDPLAGAEDMQFTLADGGSTLIVHSDLKLRSGPSCAYNTVYRR